MQDLIEVVLDTETTGLSYKQGDRIIEIGCVKLKNKIHTGETFHTFVNPGKRVSEGAFNVHGISNEFLKDKKSFLEIKDDFIDFIKDSKLIIHNAKFDIGFINHEFSMLGIPKISMNSVVDTLMIARNKVPGSSVSLDSLCKRFGISLDSRDKHGALIDAKLLAMVYVKMLTAEQSSINFDTKDSISEKELLEFPKRDFFIGNQERDMHKRMLSKIKDNIWQIYD